MIEIERQIREAPDIFVICQYSEQEKRVHIARFTDEAGETITYPGQDEFRRIMGRAGMKWPPLFQTVAKKPKRGHRKIEIIIC